MVKTFPRILSALSLSENKTEFGHIDEGSTSYSYAQDMNQIILCFNSLSAYKPFALEV